MSGNDPWQTWEEALRQIREAHKAEKDPYKRAILIAHVAQIELLKQLQRSVNRIPIQSMDR